MINKINGKIIKRKK